MKPASSKSEIIARLRQSEVELRSLGVKRLALFGSFLRNEQRPESDVDLLLEFQPEGKNFDNFMSIANLVEEILQRNVELVTTEALSPYIGPHILSEVEDVLLAA